MAPRARFVHGLAGVVVLSVIAACSLVQKLDAVQCSVDADCGPSTPAMTCVANVCTAPASSLPDGGSSATPGNDGTPWGCVGVSAWTPPSATLPATVKVYAFNGVSTLEPEVQFEPRVGVKIRLCARRDPSCTSPLTAEIESDDKGLVEFPMPTTRDFYVEGKKEGLTPMMVIPALPGDGTRRLGQPIYVGTLTKADIDGLASLANTTQSTSLGMVLTRAIDCLGQRTQVSGITFLPEQTDPSTIVFYMADGFPSLQAKATDKDGLGGLANAPVGQLIVHGSFASPAKEIGRATGLVRAGWMTTMEIAPSSN